MSFVLFFVRTYALCTTCTAKRNEMHKVDYFFMQKLNLDYVFVFMSVLVWMPLMLLVLLLRATEVHEMTASWNDNE